jgi:hypothetical protein
LKSEWASSFMNTSFWENGTSEVLLRDGCTAPNPIDYFALRQQIFDQMVQFGQICLIIGFVIGLTMPYLGRYLKVRYGWFTK